MIAEFRMLCKRIMKPCCCANRLHTESESGFLSSLMGVAALWSVLVLCVTMQAWALNSNVVVHEAGSLRLIGASGAPDAHGNYRAGLEFQMKKGWKIYWRSAGEAGFPPQLDWAPEAHIKHFELQWPVPSRFEFAGIETFGYENRVVLPLDLQIEQNLSEQQQSQTQGLKLGVFYLSCAEICIPIQAQLALEFDGSGLNPAAAHTIAQWRGQIPVKMPRNDRFIALNWQLSSPNLLEVTGSLNAIAPIPRRLILEGPTGTFLEEAQLQALRNGKIPFSARGNYSSESLLDGPAPIRATLVGSDGTAREYELTAGLMAEKGNQIKTQFALMHTLYVALVAFMGGLILNLMPCVLPVLGLKLSSIIGTRDRTRQSIRRDFLASAAGVTSAFLAIGVALIVIRGIGYNAGWGVQFQSPLFLGIMALVTLLFSLNLFGVFSLRLPRFIAQSQRLHQSARKHNFFAGIFAVMLATPCSAPFTGTAVVLALSATPLLAGAIFLAMGIGMAAPWILVAAAPATVAYLPKPGNWMHIMRKIFALMMAATCLWLVWLLANTRGEENKTLYDWQEFDSQSIATYVQEGKTVFVDITADWCLTCKFNKRFVLEHKTIREILENAERHNIVLMRGDWTRPNKEISQFLESNQRFGIPFNSVYSVKFPQGVQLPELLSVDSVARVLNTAIENSITEN